MKVDEIKKLLFCEDTASGFIFDFVDIDTNT